MATTKTCDICKKQVKTLIEIRDVFKVAGINEFCLDCNIKVDNEGKKITRRQWQEKQKLVKQYMIAIRNDKD